MDTRLRRDQLIQPRGRVKPIVLAVLTILLTLIIGFIPDRWFNRMVERWRGRLAVLRRSRRKGR